MPEAAPRGVLFVCTGNICRSPLAEGMLRQALSGHARVPPVIDSAGIHAATGQPPEALAISVAEAYGSDIRSLRSRPFEADDFRRFGRIVALDRGHLDFLCAVRPPDYAGIISLLTDQRGRSIEVPDPYARAIRAYRRAGDLIARGLGVLLEEIATFAADEDR